MNRPHLEVADIVRAQGERFLANNTAGFTGRTKKCFAPSLTAVPRSWGDISTSAPVVAIVPSSSTPVVIGIAQSVRSQLVTVGSRLAKKNCSPSTTFTWSLPCPTNSLP